MPPAWQPRCVTAEQGNAPPPPTRACSAVVGVAALTWLAGTSLTGCAGCGVPFDVEQQGAIVVPVWVAGDCTLSGSMPVTGVPDASGQLLRWSERRTGDRCEVEATWTGTLVDMVATRAAVDAQLAAAGLEPGSIDLEITRVDPSLALAPAVTSPPSSAASGGLPADAVLSYTGEISVAGEGPVMSAAYDGEGDPLRPSIAVNTSPGLLAQVNEAWRTTAPLQGVATGRVVLALDVMAGATDVPLVELSIRIGIAGQAFPQVP